jgi:hypothetical protein
VSEAINLAIPYIKTKNSTFPQWFSNSLKYYIKKKINTSEGTRNQNLITTTVFFSYYRDLVKTAIKTDRLRWLKSINVKLKTKPKDFWKYVSKFKKNDHVVTQFKIGENVITQPQCPRIVEDFAEHLPFFFNSPSSAVIPNNARFTSSGFLNVPSISDSDFKQELRSLKPSKCVGPDEIPSFIIKDCSEIFAPLLSHVFNISLSQGMLSTLRPSCLF